MAINQACARVDVEEKLAKMDAHTGQAKENSKMSKAVRHTENRKDHVQATMTCMVSIKLQLRWNCLHLTEMILLGGLLREVIYFEVQILVEK